MADAMEVDSAAEPVASGLQPPPEQADAPLPAESERRRERRRRGFSDVPVGEGVQSSEDACLLPPSISKLTEEQEMAIGQAKKYCMEQSVAMVLKKQSTSQAQNVIALQEASQRQRALMLMCRIYVGSIYYELRDDNVRSVFGAFGPIKTIDMSYDAQTQKHKGYAFVEYETPEAAQLALEQMNGVLVGGRNVKVGRPNNVPQAAPIIQHMHQEAERHNRVYVGSIHPDLSESDIKSVFEAFGPIVSCQLCPDTLRPDKHRGYGYIDYQNPQSKIDAIQSMNLFELGGQYLRVGKALTPPLPFPGTPGAMNPFMPIAPPSAPTAMPAEAAAAAAAITAKIAQTELQEQLTGVVEENVVVPEPPPPSSSSSSSHKRSPRRGDKERDRERRKGSATSSKKESDKEKQAEKKKDAAAAAPVEKDKPAENLSLQHEETGMEIKGSNARLMLMQKLSSRKSESRVLVLKNMVGVEDVDDDLESEVTEECSKYGTVKRVIIYQEKQSHEDDAEIIVKIFVVFTSQTEAEAAIKSLDGRYFGGRIVKAELYDETKFKNNQLSD